MMQPTKGNALVSVIQVVVDGDENGNVEIYQDGHSIGGLTLADPDPLLAVLTKGGALVTDLRTAIDPSTLVM